jgi:acetate kinase
VDFAVSGLESGGAGMALCLNSGSSSVKGALLVPADAGPPGAQRRIGEAAVEGIGGDGARSWVKAPDSPTRSEQPFGGGGHAAAIETVLDLLSPLPGFPPRVIGHRVVHGGPRHTAATRVDDDLVASLESLVPLAPLHLPSSIAGIRATARRWPSIPQVACFDTAFHASLPDLARRLPLPDRVLGDEVRRYGFHGLSFAQVMWSLGSEVPGRIVIAHLGNGSSLVAVADGRAIDTTMGFTPTGGVLMGTRSGDLDPGVLFYLARTRGTSVEALEHMCEHQSGLRAIGGTADMRDLLARADHDPRAELAVRMFGYAVRKAIGGLAVALGGLDLLVFTGGIGAHAARVRAEACVGLAALGVRLDLERNEVDADRIDAAGSACVVRVMPADEEATMAREARRLVDDK